MSVLRTTSLLISALLACWPASGAAQTAAPVAFRPDPAPVSQPSIKEWLTRLHDPNPEVVREAEHALYSLGATQGELELGRSLYHPHPQARIELARSLADVEPRTRGQILYELTYDPSHEVRIAALESMRATLPYETLLARVGELAAADANSLVRGYARLLVADWQQQGYSLAPRGDAGPVPPPELRADPRMPPFSNASLPQASRQDTDARNSAPQGGMFGGLRPVVPYWLSPDSPGGGSFEIELRGPAGPPAPSSAPGIALPPAPLDDPAAAGRAVSDPLFAPAQRPMLRSSPPGLAGIEPGILDRPIEPPPLIDDLPPLVDLPEPLLLTGREAPLGFSGPSGVLPTEGQTSSHFVPMEDRWRIGFPEWDRYGRGHPPVDDYPYVEGRWYDPYNLNVLKGDYPIIGQHTFLNITATSQMLHEYRELPTPTTPFESTVDPFQEEFFGDPRQYVYTHYFKLQLSLFHGNAAFKPFDWQVRVTPIFNINYLDVEELAIVNPDVRAGTTRFRDDWSLEEYFLEAKLADISPDYDFLSVRVGSQPFTSDFRGFIFSDINRAVRLFGTRLSNRDQFNLIWFDQTEKETNSELNTFDDRHQNTVIANYFRQDFIYPGYTAQLSFHYNRDDSSFEFDENRFLVRPDPTGVFRTHEVEAYYFGIAGDGHIRRFNISNAFYIVRGEDDLNPLANVPVDINAEMAALELSYDRDWVRFRASYFWASGDDDINDGEGEGFDSIFDNPNFAGGEFSFWQRQAIKLFGVNLVQRKSLVPDLRSSKIQGQSNFVNPGLTLVNVGMDFEVTPKLRVITNANHLWFNSTRVLEQFVFQDRIRPEIGFDLSIGTEYRPFLNDNAIILAGFAALIPGNGLDDLFGITDPFFKDEIERTSVPTMYQAFAEVILTF